MTAILSITYIVVHIRLLFSGFISVVSHQSSLLCSLRLPLSRLHIAYIHTTQKRHQLQTGEVNLTDVFNSTLPNPLLSTVHADPAEAITAPQTSQRHLGPHSELLYPAHPRSPSGLSHHERRHLRRARGNPVRAALQQHGGRKTVAGQLLLLHDRVARGRADDSGVRPAGPVPVVSPEPVCVRGPAGVGGAAEGQ